MELKIIPGDIFTDASEAIVVSIDGTAKDMEGRLARRFERHYTDLWKEVTSLISYPVPLGDIFTFRAEVAAPYKMVVAAGQINHIDNLSFEEEKSVVFTVFSKTLRDCLKYGIKSLACTPMKGGFRLDSFNAFLAMWQAVEKEVGYHKPLDINLYVLEEEDYKVIYNYAVNMHILE